MAKPGKIPAKRRGTAWKTETIEQMEALFRDGDGIVLLDNIGLSVGQANALRAKLTENKVTVKVAKNTLIKIAFERAGFDTTELAPLLKGPTMVAVGTEDPVSAAKGIAAFLKEADFEKDKPKLVIKGGILERKVLGLDGVVELSKMPGREEMVAMLLGSIQAPAQNLCYALNASVCQFAWALNAYKAKLEEEAA